MNDSQYDHEAVQSMTLTPAHAGAGLRWVAMLERSPHWTLTRQELATLLGVTSTLPLQQWIEQAERDEAVDIPEPVIERIGWLIAILNRLDEMAPSHALKHVVLKLAKPLTCSPFNGQSIQNYLRANPTPDAFHTIVSVLRATPYL